MRSSDGTFELEVFVHGRPVQEYPHQGQVFFEGRRGSEYTMRVRNNSRRRAAIVISVDGLSVMDGQQAGRQSPGYIVEPCSYVDVPGWRLNNQEVAHFFFGSLPEAYASQTGHPENIGVIGAVCFYEKQQYPYHQIDMKPRKPEPTLTFGEESVVRGIGTGFGHRTEHRVISAAFNREEQPAAELTIRYDDTEGLRARGIIVTSAHYTGDRVVEARPFPKDEVGASPPPGWRG